MITTSFAQVGPVKFAYIEAGDGPLVLFGHGTFGGKELFLPQIDRLANEFHCVAIDWPGHGESNFDPAGWDVNDLVAAVPRLIEVLRHESAFLVGLSQGGAVFTRVALDHPGYVRGLVNMSAGPDAPPAEALAKMRSLAITLRDEPDDAVRRTQAERFVNSMFHAKGFAESNRESARREIDIILGHPRAGIAGVPDVPASYTSVADRLSEISCPVLVIWGSEDARPELGAEIAAHIPGSLLAVIEHAGHHVNVDAPSETASAIEVFLRSLIRNQL